MTSHGENDAKNTSIGAFRRCLLRGPNRPPDRGPLILSAPHPGTMEEPRKKGFAAAALRGLGCASASATEVHAPEAAAAAAVRSSADWHGGGKRSRRPRVKQKRAREVGVGSDSGEAASAADIWCSPGMDIGADDRVARHPATGRRSMESGSVRRERSYVSRHVNSPEFSPSFADSTSILDVPMFGFDHMASYNLRRGWSYRRSPGGLEEILMFQTRILLGEMEIYDQYQDMRLDVDDMSYEELLELGDKIGHVSTGLREEDISLILRKAKRSAFDPAATANSSSEVDWKCSICQEEYGAGDEMGKLACGHGFHLCCIKQWLLRKNACPVCKACIATSGKGCLLGQ